MLGGWLAAVGGAWFVVGGAFAPVFGLGSAGDPVAATDRKRAVLEVAYFSGLGVLIAFLAGAVLARLAVVLARDVQPVAAVDRAPVSQPYVAPVDAPRQGEVATDALTDTARAVSGSAPPKANRGAAACSVATAHRSRTPSSHHPTEADRRRQAGGRPRLSSEQAEQLQVGDVLDDHAGEICGMSLSGPIFASCTAARNRSVGAIDPRIGCSGFW